METARLWAQLNFLYPERGARIARGRFAYQGFPMNMNRLAIAAAVALAIGAGGYGLYRLGLDRGMQSSVANHAATSRRRQAAGRRTDAATGRKVLYWHDPMVPGQKFDKPGKSPFMDMQLVPVYAEAGADEGQRRDQPARAAEPRRAHRGGHARARWRRPSKRWATSPTTSATSRSCRRAANGFVERLLRAGAARPGAAGPAARRAVRSRLGRGAGGIPVRRAHGRRTD